MFSSYLRSSYLKEKIGLKLRVQMTEVFTTIFPQRLSYCEDISKLPNCKISDPHFLYSDIQIGKGKVGPKHPYKQM